ncbi:hypothetical protein PUN28_017759 [Cardiocondyla obscurior]|uniref:Uncharacterized protein n=1 Tax=Cardiocondyla obscurior TaxID=286306 RepID=A0AAW2EMT7_9HYME
MPRFPRIISRRDQVPPNNVIPPNSLFVDARSLLGGEIARMNATTGMTNTRTYSSAKYLPQDHGGEKISIPTFYLTPTCR